MYKHQGRGYGKLPGCIAPIVPFEQIQVDLIGPWKITINNTDIIFKALTIINPATNLIEIIQINNKRSKTVTQAFSNNWIARYPWPVKCIHDNGGEFLGIEFQELLSQLGIVLKPTTVKIPQANRIVEQSHKTIMDML